MIWCLILTTSETELNSAMSEVLNDMRENWNVKGEQMGKILEGGKRPDIIITEEGYAPVIIENEFEPAITVETDAKERLHLKHRDTGLNIESLIAIKVPKQLKNFNGMELRSELTKTNTLQYVIYTPERYPDKGWIIGNLVDIVTAAQIISIPKQQVEECVNLLNESMKRISNHINTLNDQKKQEIANRLNQNPCEQTWKMAALVTSNALLFYDIISGTNEAENINIKSISKLHILGSIPQNMLVEAWNNVLKINYYPIFKVAQDILQIMNEDVASKVIQELVKTNGVVIAKRLTRSSDMYGLLFQKVISDRSKLATFYTRPESAVLIATIVVPSPTDNLWNDENILKYRVADFACGTGILLTSIYKKIISNYEINGGNMKIMHTRMMENCIHGLDVLPIATHLTVSALASIFPTRIFTKTKIHTMPIGIQLKGEKDYRLGSLDLIDDTNKSTLFPSSQQITGSGESGSTHHGIHDASCDLIVMNPPFVRPTNHVGTHQGDAVPAYAAFNTTIEDQKEMGKLASKKFQGTCANGNAGLASNFVAICDKKIAKNGTIALILPATICNGESWSAVRTLFNKYDITVISIARKELKLEDYAFSSDTGIGEIILIAKKHDKPKNSNNRGKFVVLSERPSSILSGIHIGTIIKKQGIIHKLENVHGGSLLKVGDKIVGTMLDCPIDKFWPFVNVVDPALIQYMHKITNNTTTKFITLGKISMVGPHALDITGNNLRGPFDRHYIDGIPLYPTLWNNDKDAQSSLIVKPDQMLIPRIDAKNDHVEKIWNTSTHMHININPRYTSQSIIAAYTNVPSVGGRSWPSIILNKKYEKALTIWCNSIFGIFYFWYITGKQQFGRGMSSRTAILSLLVPDFNTFDPKKLRLYNSLFDKYRYEKLLPICQLHRDSTRKKIDNELADILDIDINLDDLRLRLCSEPSISGGKLDDDLKKFDRGLLSFDSA